MNLIPYCKYCGNKVSMFATKCPSCTAWLGDAPEQTERVVIVEDSESTGSEGMITLGIVLGLIAGFAYSMYNVGTLGFFVGFGVIMLFTLIGAVCGAVLSILFK